MPIHNIRRCPNTLDVKDRFRMQSEVVKGLNTVHSNAKIPLEVGVLLANMHFWWVFLMFCLLVGPPNPRRLHPTSISYIFKVV